MHAASPLPFMARVVDAELVFAKRCIKTSDVVGHWNSYIICANENLILTCLQVNDLVDIRDVLGM